MGEALYYICVSRFVQQSPNNSSDGYLATVFRRILVFLFVVRCSREFFAN